MSNQTVTLDFTGTKKLQDVLKKLGARSTQAAKAALYQEAERIMTASKKRCPVDLGNLRASGQVSLPSESGGHIVVELGYGGPAGAGNHGGETNKEHVGYAIVQHEDLSLDHSKRLSAKESKRRGGVVWGEIGGPKYLENPVLDAAKDLEVRLGRQLKRELERNN